MFWVSKRAFDEVRDERDYQRAVNEELRQELVRIARRTNGMAEVPKDKRPEDERIPKPVKEAVALWGNDSTQRMLRKRVREMRAAGETWETILNEILPA